MTDKIHAPWTPEQVDALNRFQQYGGMHPFTCGNDDHSTSVVLMAHHDGWHCSDPACGYRQDWAHAFMADPTKWPKPFPRGRSDVGTEFVQQVDRLDGDALDDVEAELTAEEARDLADDLGLQLYRAQDALTFVEECCVIADREQRTITTADVREWLKGARCARQLAAETATEATDGWTRQDDGTWTMPIEGGTILFTRRTTAEERARFAAAWRKNRAEQPDA